MPRVRLRFSALALVGVTAVVLAAPVAAPAVTRTVEYGQPGAAQMPAVRGWWNPNGGTLRMPSRHVSRTPQSPQPQTICADYTLFRFTAAYYEEPWAYEASRHWCVRATGPGRAVVPKWNYSAFAYSSYTLSVAITWRVTGGPQLASAHYDYVLVKDYRCQTKNCSSAVRYQGVSGIRFDS
jgi:hypothetical protein